MSMAEQNQATNPPQAGEGPKRQQPSRRFQLIRKGAPTSAGYSWLARCSGRCRCFLWNYLGGFESTDDAQVDVHLYPVERSRISGYIQDVNVGDNQSVEAGSTD